MTPATTNALTLLASLLGASTGINRRVNCRLALSEYKPSSSIIAANSYSVYSLEGNSAITAGYSYTAIFVSDESIAIEELCDTTAVVSLQDEINPLNKRSIHGMIATASQKGSVGRKHLYEIVIVSPTHYLGLNQRSEIYQDKNVLDIISLILKRYEALLHISLSIKADTKAYPIRHTTTQYFQSDWEFITMLCEQEGLVIITDDSSSSPYALTLCTLNSHVPQAGILEANYNLSKGFNTSHHTHDHHDPQLPSGDVVAKKSIPSSGVLSDNTHTSQLRQELTVASWNDRVELHEGSLAKEQQRSATLDSLRSYASQVSITGQSNDLSLKSATLVTLNDTKLFTQEQAIILNTTTSGFFPNALDELIESDHEHKEQYTISFKAIPNSITYVPPYTITPPRIDGLHTAIVSKGDKETTKGANEIDVNDKGEIRVIMHFDPNYPTSVYVPLSTPYAGDNYGSRFLPRVNSEVLIGYLNGNIDKPIITSMIHNGENTIPYDLPSTKTQSYIKTQTMPQYSDKEGYNEILFEDAQNNEQLNLRAQKDYSLLALNDATEHIQHDHSTTIDNNQDLTVHGYQTEQVNKAKTETIMLAKALTVGAGYQVSVGASKNETVGVSSSEQVGVNKYTMVGTRYEVNVGSSSITMNADGTILVQGTKISIVGSEHVEVKSKLVDMN